MPTGRLFQPGYDPRRSLGRLSAAERDFRKAVEAEHFPKANAALHAIYEAGMKQLSRKTNPKSNILEAWFKICGLMQKPRDDARLEAMALHIVQQGIADAQARRAAEVAAQSRLSGVGTDEE